MDIIVLHLNNQDIVVNGGINNLNDVLKPYESNRYEISVPRFNSNIDLSGNIIGERIDFDIKDLTIPIVYQTSITANDFFVRSPKVNDNPDQALEETIVESEKGEGKPKSIALIALSITKYLKSKKAKIK